jgi:PAS domain-containing protein
VDAFVGVLVYHVNECLKMGGFDEVFMGFKKEDSRDLAGEEPRMPDQETGRAREELFRLLVENQQDLIVKTDLQGVLLYVNPPYGRLFDKDPAALIGTSYAPLVHPDDLTGVQAAVPTKSVPRPLTAGAGSPGMPGPW